MNKRLLVTLILCTLLFLSHASFVCAEDQGAFNPIIKLLNEIEYTSRLKFEYDDNIFLTENDEESDMREIFTQTLTYKLPKDNHYFQLGYKGNYEYYNEESVGVLGHTANVLYSYRPFDGLSIGIRDDYNWLQDSAISTTIGDRVIALGYIQNMPSLQLKYEMNPKFTLTTDVYYQFLDVRDKDNDDYIDNKRFGAKGQFEYNFTPKRDIIGFAGFEHKQVAFPQISEKSSVSGRAFAGLTKKIPGLFHVTTEVGFENIDMDDTNVSDDNIDAKIDFETVFSLFTKARLSVQYNAKKTSLRSEYTQYGSTKAAVNLSHAINPKTTVQLDYSFERQEFNSSDVLSTQARVDRWTDIHKFGTSLKRKLNKWLTCDFSYDYTNRDTDFTAESYDDNVFSVALTAKY